MGDIGKVKSSKIKIIINNLERGKEKGHKSQSKKDQI